MVRKRLLIIVLGSVMILLTVWVTSWLNPRTVQSIQQPKKIAVLAEDLRNGGILGVTIGMAEAVNHTPWQMMVFDASSDRQQREEQTQTILQRQPDGVAIVGTDVKVIPDFLAALQERGIPVVGWHVAPYPGAVPNTPVQVNVTTDSREVAIAAAAEVQPAKGARAGVIIFTDSRIGIAWEKSTLMQQTLEKTCPTCDILQIADIALGDAATLTPPAISSFLKQYGDRWTHSLAINDLYFDHAIRELIEGDQLPPKNISAGDGSPSALLRIKYHSFQYASVAEPLLLHGWQVIDELQRLMSGKAPSGYVNPPYTVTQSNIDPLLNEQNFFEPNPAYRQKYLTEWKK
jgi:ribose transport system substrate-binding protein